MKISLRGEGFLRDYFGREPQAVCLPDNCTLSDLLRWIEEHHAKNLPPHLWDFQKHGFHGSVVLVIDEKITLDPNAALWDGIEVSVMYAVAGG